MKTNTLKMSLEEIVQGIAEKRIKFYKNNPKCSGKAISSLLSKPFVEGGLAGFVFYEQPSGGFVVLDGNTRLEYLPLRSDWDVIKSTVVHIVVTDNWQEALQIINTKQKHVRGRAPNSELALNVDFPCGKLLWKIMKIVAARIGAEKSILTVPHLQKAPQHIFDIMDHLQNSKGGADALEYNTTRAHAQRTSDFINAGPERNYSEFVSPLWEEKIANALEAYALLLQEHKPAMQQNPSVDKLLGVGKGALNPGFWVIFMMDHMADGRGSWSAFSKQSPRRLLQHIRSGSNASNLWAASAAFLRTADSLPRTEIVKAYAKYAQ
jgi:hypothetical protein